MNDPIFHILVSFFKVISNMFCRWKYSLNTDNLQVLSKPSLKTRNRLCLQIIETRMRMRSQQRCNWDTITTRKSRLCASYTSTQGNIYKCFIGITHFFHNNLRLNGYENIIEIWVWLLGMGRGWQVMVGSKTAVDYGLGI